MAAEAMKSSADIFKEDRTEEVSALSRKVFNRIPERVAFPGGTTRAAFVADMGDGIYVFAKREDTDAAQLEGIVLKNLGDGGYVPRLKAVAGEWVVQECVDGERLPIALDKTDNMKERELLVELALLCLHQIHKHARDANLSHRMPKVGAADGWLRRRSGVAKRISKTAGIPVPELDRERLMQIMDVKRDEFVKWDARPGNALFDTKRVVWFDWEDCGRSKALDDLAFVLCDEWTSLDAEAEGRLIEKFFPLFNTSMSADQGEHYFRIFGVTHCMLRLRRALKLRDRKDKWWDRQYCLERDKVGVTHEECSRLIQRINRLAYGVEEWNPLFPWVEQLADHYKLEL